MASVPNSPWFCSLKPTKPPPSSLFSNPRNPTFKSLNFSFLSNSPNAESSSDKSSEPEKTVIDPVKLAFEKAKAYKKSAELKTSKAPVIIEQPVLKSVDGGEKIVRAKAEVTGGKSKEGSDVFRAAMERAKEYEKSKGG